MRLWISVLSRVCWHEGSAFASDYISLKIYQLYKVFATRRLCLFVRHLCFSASFIFRRLKMKIFDIWWKRFSYCLKIFSQFLRCVCDKKFALFFGKLLCKNPLWSITGSNKIRWQIRKWWNFKNKQNFVVTCKWVEKKAHKETFCRTLEKKQHNKLVLHFAWKIHFGSTI